MELVSIVTIQQSHFEHSSNTNFWRRSIGDALRNRNVAKLVWGIRQHNRTNTTLELDNV